MLNLFDLVDRSGYCAQEEMMKKLDAEGNDVKAAKDKFAEYKFRKHAMHVGSIAVRCETEMTRQLKFKSFPRGGPIAFNRFLPAIQHCMAKNSQPIEKAVLEKMDKVAAYTSRYALENSLGTYEKYLAEKEETLMKRYFRLVETYQASLQAHEVTAQLLRMETDVEQLEADVETGAVGDLKEFGLRLGMIHDNIHNKHCEAECRMKAPLCTTGEISFPLSYAGHKCVSKKIRLQADYEPKAKDARRERN